MVISWLCVPDCTICPSSKTIIWSAFLAEEILWLTIMVVLSFVIVFRLVKIFSSVSVSTADKQSSKIKILGFLIIALAIETRCFCPPDNVTPLSPKIVLYLFLNPEIFSWITAFFAALIISYSGICALLGLRCRVPLFHGACIIHVGKLKNEKDESMF